MKTNIFIIVMIIVLGIASHYGFYELGKKNAEIKYIRDTDTLITYRTITDTKIIPKYTTITKTDTIINTDTLFLDNTEYIATLDTTYEDDLAKIKVDFISDIPLSKKSYFNLELDVKKETIFVPTYVKDESFWHNRLIVYLGGGVSYGIDSKTIEPALQIGLGVRIN